MTSIRLVAVDLDDCLLGPGAQIPAASLDALDDLSNRGILWCAATGRALGRLSRTREILYPSGGWIWAHGAQARIDSWRRSQTLAGIDVLSIADFLSRDFPGAVMATDCGEILYRDAAYPEPIWPGRRHTVCGRDTMGFLGADMIRIHSQHITDITQEIEAANLPVQIWDVGREGYAEITASTATKLSALGMLATYLGIKDCEVAAIGDGHSDAGMLKWAAMGVSFTDAHPAAQAGADLLVDAGAHEPGRFVRALALVTDYSGTR